jgi:hypothetical protein
MDIRAASQAIQQQVNVCIQQVKLLVVKQTV